MKSSRFWSFIFLSCLLLGGFYVLVTYQRNTASGALARLNDVNAAITALTLNSGIVHVASGSDITSQATDLLPDIGAYRWTGAGTTYAALNVPFNSGATQTDFSANGYTATTAGNAAYTSVGCQVGGCLQFDGVDDYAVMSTTAPVLNLTSLSISLWANLSTGGDLIGNHNNGSTWESFILSTGSFVLNSANNSTTNRKILAYTFPVDSAWHHVAAVWNGSNMFVYVDGALAAGPLAFTGTPWANTFPAYIGAERSSATPPAIAEVAGKIDELQLYRRALTADQIAALYADGLAGVGGPTMIKATETVAGQYWNLAVTPITSAGEIGSTMVSANPAVITTGASAITGSLNDANEGIALASTLTIPPSSVAGLQWVVNDVPYMKLSYPFNSGPIVDVSGNSFTGTVNGPVFTTTGCKVGGCMSFDGVNDYILSSGTTGLTGNPSFSIESWVYIPANATLTGTYPTFVWWGTASSADAAMFGMYSTSRNQIFIGVNGGGQRMTGTLTNDAWHHVVWSRTGGGNISTGNVLYVDGSSVPLTNDLTATLTPTIAASAFELQRGGTGVDYITAKLDEVKVYNRAVSADEAYRSYLDGLGSGPTAADGVGSPTRIVTAGHALNDAWSLVVQEFLSDGTTGGHSYIASDTIQAAAVTTLAVTTPATQQTENVTITYTCANADNQMRDILVQYSNNGGSSYSNARLVSSSSGSISSNTVLGSTCDGSSQTVTWDSLVNQVGINNTVDNDVRIKLTIGITGSPAAETTNFSVLNPIFFSSSTSIGSAVTTYDNLDVTCSGVMTLTIDGTHTFSKLRALNGCTITHTLNTSAIPNITVTGDVIIDSASSINLNYKGYRGGRSDGNTTSGNGGRYGEGPGGGQGFDCFGCAATGGGGSHGGRGGNGQSGNNNGAAGAVNDSYSNPVDKGSGGGAHTSGSGVGEGGNGGGAIIFTIGGTFTNNGSITANGEQAPGGAGGGGSGGTVNITAANWAGAGSITANAGSGTGNGGDGGGGRIALVSTSGSFPNYTLSARAGGTSTGQKGGAGTIYKLEPGQDADLIINNGGFTPFNIDGATPLSPTANFRTITIQNAGALTSLASITALTMNVDAGQFISSINTDHFITATSVTNSGNLTAITRVSATDTSLRITGASLSVDATSTINLNGKGYRGGRTSTIASTYNGEGAGASSGGDCFGCSYGIGGAGHGGKGANGSGGTNNSNGGAANGSFSNPTSMGSGAAGSTSGSASSAGGSGGGLVILSLSGTFTNNGSVTANGNNGVNKGGGAGGGINITAATFVGSGSFFANGGAPGDTISGAGAGGRIALIATTATIPGTYTYQATSGGGTGQKSGAGTVYLKNAGVDGDLIIDNNNIVIQTAILEDSTPISGNNTLRNVTVQNQGVLVLTDAQTIAALSVLANGKLVAKTNVTHTIDTTTIAAGGTATARKRDGTDYSLRINGTSFTVESGGFVNLDGKGYRGGASNGAAIGSGEGSGGGGYAGCFGCTRSGGGGGFGGQGASGTAGAIGAGGAAYGSYFNPLDMGSGGGASQSGSAVSAAGDGGGLFVLNLTGVLTNNGTITALGTDGSAGANGAGAGSGGALNITALSMAGTGSFSVAGGNAAATLGLGAGGRIAMTTTFGTISSSFTYTVRSGNGAGSGAASGTLFMQQAGHTYPDLVLNNGSVTSVKFTPLFITGQPATATVEDLSVINSAKLLIDTPCSGVPALTILGTTDLSGGGTITNNQSVTCTVTQQPVTITPASLSGSEVGSAYSYSLVAIGGYGPYFWSCRSGGATVACASVLPPGLDMSTSGVITGTPTTLGLYPFTVRVAEAAPGASFDEEAFSIGIGVAPSAPTSLFVHNTDAQLGNTDPSGIDDSPFFSAVFIDPDVAETATKYRIQVDDNSDFSSPLWDTSSTGISLSVPCANGVRCANISYAGSALSLDASTYYWRIKFWDELNVEGAFSATNQFITDASPSAPTALFSNDATAQVGLTNPVGVLASHPVFSAIYNDPDTTDIATKYRIQVDDNDDFSSAIWDSGAAGTAMVNCSQGTRCNDIVFGGADLEADETVYYWRIKYFDQSGVEGPWSQDPISTNKFTMGLGGSSQQRIAEQQQQDQQLNSVPSAPIAGAVEVVDAHTLRYNWIDTSTNETGFRIFDANDQVVVEVPVADSTRAAETNLPANSVISGRKIVAYNAVGQSGPSEFAQATTAVEPVRPLLQQRGPNSVTFSIEPAIIDFVGQTAVKFEVIVISPITGQTRTLTSDWVQANEYVFEGIADNESVQVRTQARNQEALAAEPSSYEDISAITRQFHVTLRVTKKGTNELPRPLAITDTLEVSVQIQNIGADTATNVLVSMPLPKYILYRSGSLGADGRSQTDGADQDVGQAGGNAVSAIWGQMAPNESHSLSFELAFDEAALNLLRPQTPATASSADSVIASANPIINLQVAVSFAESDQVFSSPIVNIEPDLAAPEVVIDVPPVVEPFEEPVALPTEDEVVQINEFLNQIIQQEVEETGGDTGATPAPAETQAPTVVSSDGPSFNVEVTNEAGESLSLTGLATANQDQIEFTGTTSQPFSIVMLIFNDSVTSIVVSDANGNWRTFVSADQLGIKPGQEASVKIEAIASKGDLRSERVQVGEVKISLGRSGDIEAEFDTTVSSNATLTVINEVRKEVVRVIEEQQPVIQTTLSVTAPVVVVSSVPLWGYLPYIPTMIYHFLTYLLGLIGRKKKGQQRFYGVVYDSITKLPLPLAIVRIYTHVIPVVVIPTGGEAVAEGSLSPSRKLVSTTVTDKLGRYEALLAPGKYTLEVTKPTYQFPSQIVTTEIDANYHIYKSQDGMTIGEQGTEITVPDVPLDPVNAQRQWQLSGGVKKVWMAVQKVGNYLAVPVLLVGSIASVVTVAAVPDKGVNWLLAIMYVLLLAAQLRLRPKLMKAWGVVYDIATNAVLPLTTIQLIDPQYGKVVTSRLSDYEGRFSFLPEPGSYVLKATRAGYEHVEVVETPSSERQPMSNKVVIEKADQAITGDVAMKSTVV